MCFKRKGHLTNTWGSFLSGCFQTSWRWLCFKSIAITFSIWKLFGMYLEGNPFQQIHLSCLERYPKCPTSCTWSSCSNLNLFIFLKAWASKHSLLVECSWRDNPWVAFVPYDEYIKEIQLRNFSISVDHGYLMQSLKC